VFGLLESINSLETFYDSRTGVIRVPDDFLSPGFWVLLSAFTRQKKIPQANLQMPEAKTGYASAIGLPRALWGTDDYPYERRDEGRDYSSLEHLDRVEAVDGATSRINSCIRHFIGEDFPPQFIDALCDVVGDLHDNVWSHGEASGFSMSQKWKVPHVKNDSYLEFALADVGKGFLRELHRVGIKISSAQDAIEWCVQEGTSTKKERPGDDWVQTVPADVINNPLKGIGKIKTSDNHHLGLGLFKLTRLVETFRGRLWLATGNAVLVMAPNGKKSYIRPSYPWQGVAITCRFRSSRIKKAATESKVIDQDVERVLGYLKRSS